MTPQELLEAEAAAKVAEKVIAPFIPEAEQVKLVTLVIQQADASVDQSVDGRFNAAKAALLKAIADAGHSGQVPDGTIDDVVDAILNAVAALRPPPPSA